MSTDKPNIRPGVRAICRNGFWTPPLEQYEHPVWKWRAGLKEWSDGGLYRSFPSDWDIIGIVEDLPTVPSPQHKSYWRLLEVGEVIQEGDEFYSRSYDKWRIVMNGGDVVESNMIYRRRVTAPEPQPKGHWTENEKQCTFIPHEEFEQLKADAAKWREHVANPQPAPQIPGMPEGYEFDPDLCAFARTTPPERTVSGWRPELLIPIRRIKPPEPVCTWQHGLIRDGWYAEDANGQCYWHENKPTKGSGEWIEDGLCRCVDFMIDKPKFRDDLPWDQRIVKVGPEAEALLKGGA